MKTIVGIDDHLPARAMAAASHEHRSLTRLIEEGLILRLRLTPVHPAAEKIQLPVFNGGSGLAPGVDPLSNRSMYEAADSSDLM